MRTPELQSAKRRGVAQVLKIPPRIFAQLW
jgi:hypothetical protein